jgi:hypothetical protein
VGAGEVVRGAARDDGEGDLQPPGELGADADRAVAAGHHDAVERPAARHVLEVPDGVDGDLRAVRAEAVGELVAAQAPPGAVVGDEGEAHGGPG